MKIGSLFSDSLLGKSWALRPALLLFSSAILVVLVGFPVLAIVLFAIFPHINEWSFAAPFSVLLPNLTDDRLLKATFNSLRLASSVTMIAAVIAVPLAYVRSRFSDRVGKICDGLFLIPFLIPPYIGSLAWMQLLQRNGFVEQLFGFNLATFLYSFAGIVSVMALHLFPLIYFTTANIFSVIGTHYGDVARVFGGRSATVFWRINFPMALPSLVSSGLIVFILTIEEFGTPEILGARFGFPVIVTAIHEKFSDWPIDLPGASVLSLILIVIAFFAFRMHQRLTERYQTTISGQPLSVRNSSLPPVVLGAFLLLFGSIFVVSVVLPMLTIAISSFMDTLSGGLAGDNFSFRTMEELFAKDGEAWSAIGTSLFLAALAAILTVLIAIVVVFTVVRLRIRGTVFLDFLSILPNSIPGMAVAVGLILTWNQSFWPVTPYNSLLILLMAYLCLMLPYPIRMIGATLKQLPQSLDDAAYLSGAGDIRVMVTILAPLLWPIALAAGFIVFAISTRELVSSIMLAPPGVETVAIYVFHQFDQGSINAGMAMSLVTIILSGGLLLFGQHLKGTIK